MAQEPAAVMLSRMNAAQAQPQENPMLRNLRLQQQYRKNVTADEKRMLSQVTGANNQALTALEAELLASGMDKNAVRDIIRAERQGFTQAQKDYQNMFRAEAGTQRFAGFGEGNYYAPTYQYAGPEAEAIRQRFIQGQQFMQQLGMPQFYRQGRTAIGIREPQAYALSQAMADGQVTADELTSQYGQYFNPKQAERAASNINAIQPFLNNPNITAESFQNKLKPVKGQEGLYQTKLTGGKYNNVMGFFRDTGNGQYQYLGAAPTKTKKKSGGFFGNVLRIGGALISPFFPAAGAIASGIGTLASGGNLGQALLGAGTSLAGASVGSIAPGLAVSPGLSSAIGGGIAGLTPVNPPAPPMPNINPVLPV